jgi:demethylmenaquinone methyltransferase / 2-methoxy-6-polyprenyl-1,4-benzoquinol methylase
LCRGIVSDCNVSNEYFDAGDKRAAKVEALFNRIAPRYDLINDLQSFGLHRRWKSAMVKLARPGTGDKALDVCCGTGDIAKALARRGVEVVGLDFCQRMLDCSGQGDTPNPTYIRGDAQALPFPDHSFDIVTVGYGLRNLASWERGLEEMARVAKPGGRVLVLDFGKPDNRVWRALYFGYLRAFVPVLGLVFCGSAAAYAYILESLKHYPAQRGIERHMLSLGMEDVRVVSFLGGIMTINYGRKPSGNG